MRLSSSNLRLFTVGLAIVTGIIGTASLVSAMNRASLVEAYRQATANLGNGMAKQTSLALAAVDNTLIEIGADTAARLAAVRTADPLGGRAVYDLLANRRQLPANVEALGVVDAGGKLVNSTRAWPPIALDAADRDYFVHLSAVDDPAVFVSAPVKSEYSGQWTMFMARRVNDGAGRFAGIVLAVIGLPDLEEFYRTAMPAKRTVTLLRDDGVVLVRYPHQEAAIGKAEPPAAPWRTVVAHGGGTYEAADAFAGVDVLASVHPLRTLPLVVEAEVAQAEVLAEWHRQNLAIAGGAMAALVSVIAFLCVLARSVRRLEQSELSLAAKNAQLETARQQFDAALTNLSQGVCFFDGQQRLIVCNRRYAELYDLPPEAIRPGMSLAEIVDMRLAAGSFPDTTRSEYLASRNAVAQAGTPAHSVVELCNGRTIAIQHQPMPDGGWVATHEDITERRRAEAKIAFLARHDVLTGLANRALLHEHLAQALAAGRRGAEFAVLFLDLDRFKSINDTMGHPFGDELLRAVAARLLACARDVDTVARLGGDEFVILQVALKMPEHAAQLADRIIKAFEEPFRVHAQEVTIATSIGVAVAPMDGGDADILLKNADLALYIAKGEGRGRFRFFEPEMDARVQLRHGLEQELRAAIAQDRFEIHYQPLVDVHSGRLCAFEALLRWNHPVRGLMAPDAFIPIAEECGLIVSIGEWVLGEACREAARWPEGIRLAVNLSPMQIRAPGFVPMVLRALADSSLAAERLELEVTETVLLQSNDAVLAVLHRLRGLGVAIALDDFGVGYSSLGYLRRFTFDKVKIDRSFVQDLTRREDALFIVRAILGLCASLGIRTTAEGVETQAQYDILVREGCSEVQGYLFGHPTVAEELGQFVAEERLGVLVGGE